MSFFFFFFNKIIKNIFKLVYISLYVSNLVNKKKILTSKNVFGVIKKEQIITRVGVTTTFIIALIINENLH